MAKSPVDLGIEDKDTIIDNLINKLTKDSKTKEIEEVLKLCLDTEPIARTKIYNKIKNKTDANISDLRKVYVVLSRRAEKRKPIDKIEQLLSKNRLPNRFQKVSICFKEKGDNLLKDPKMLRVIIKEFSKDHVSDEKELLLVFLAHIGGLMLPRYRKGIKLAGFSSGGKDNLAKTVLKHIPEELNKSLTQSSDKYFQRQLSELPPTIYFKEVNMKQKKGANVNIIELIKALSEDGMSYGYNEKEGDKIIQVETDTERKVCMYSTTDIGGDDELLNRFIVVNVSGSEEQTKGVINKIGKHEGDVDSFIKRLKNKESFIDYAICNLEQYDGVVVPYLDKIKEYVDTSQLTARRYYKTLRNVIAWSCFLHQKQRKKEEKEGFKILIADPIDLYYALDIVGNQLDQSYHGLEPRLKKIIKFIKKCPNDWVKQTELKNELKLNKKMAWQAVSELDNLNVIEIRHSPEDKRYNELKLIGKGKLPFLTKKKDELFIKIGGDPKTIDSNLLKPIETYLVTHSEDQKTIDRKEKEEEKKGIGNLVPVSVEKRDKVNKFIKSLLKESGKEVAYDMVVSVIGIGELEKLLGDNQLMTPSDNPRILRVV